jgi:phenylpropionate dioxygenase-like ring-hydroxylating dioxygenase large terminal subunit
MTTKTATSTAPTTAPLVKTTRRGAVVKFRNEDEFHQCWYPVALSAEVPIGGVIGSPFLDGRVVIYRTSDGIAHVQSAYCRHLGADLSLGKMVGDRLQCPFHFWRYDTQGACVEIPAGDRPPKAARLFVYPTAESLGIIWAFNGETPIHSVPHFDVDEKDLQVDAFRNPRLMAVDSALVFINGFDVQHFKVVHGMPMDDLDESKIQQRDYTLRYQVKTTTPEFGDVIQNRTMWGVNTVVSQNESKTRKIYLIHSLCPVSQNTTQGFLVNAIPKSDVTGNAADLDKMRAASREYSLRLVNEDGPIFDTIGFRRDCLTPSDRLLGFGMQYVTRYPRAHPGREMITK